MKFLLLLCLLIPSPSFAQVGPDEDLGSDAEFSYEDESTWNVAHPPTEDDLSVGPIPSAQEDELAPGLAEAIEREHQADVEDAAVMPRAKKDVQNPKTNDKEARQKHRRMLEKEQKAAEAEMRRAKWLLEMKYRNRPCCAPSRSLNNYCHASTTNARDFTTCMSRSPASVQ